MLKKLIIFTLTICFITAPSFFAKEKADIKGSKDHTLISRYPGSIIVNYTMNEFDEYTLPTGLPNRKGKLTKTKKLEGKVTRITYTIPKGRSTLEVFRNYEIGLKKAGFESIFKCSGKKLDNGSYRKWPDLVYPVTNRFLQLRGKSENQRYFAAKIEKNNQQVFVSLYVSLGWYPYSVVQLDIIEIKKMESDLITVNAETLKNDLNENGHATVHGIYFDTDKATLKSESIPAIKEVAKLLKENPNLKIYIVGHTDNTGKFSHNMGLSQKRSESVMKELTANFKINSKQLSAYGVGPLAPVTSNNTEQGRAKNRRVEIIKQ